MMVNAEPQGSSNGHEQAGSSEQGPDLKDRIKDAADNLKDKAAEGVEDVKQRAEDFIESKQGAISEQVGHVSSAIDAAASKFEESGGNAQISGFVRDAAKSIEALSSSLENKTPREMCQVAENMARQQPLMFFAGATLLGLIAGRFIRASRPGQEPDSSAGSY